MSRVLAVAGVGPGSSSSIVRKFVEDGWSVGMLARSTDYPETLAREIEGDGVDALAVQADVSVPADVDRAFARIREELGPVDVLVNHAANFHPGGLSDLDPDQFEEMWRVCAYGSFLCSQAVVPEMLERNDGTIIFTGANVGKRAQKNAVGFSSAKFAVRGLAQGLARELGPRGIHVAHVVIHGQIDTPRTRQLVTDVDPEDLLDADAIAETYRHLARQPARSLTTEVNLRTYR